MGQFFRRAKIFHRYTPSARRAIYYAVHGASLRGSPEITPEDILLGLSRDHHDEECGFRFLREKCEELARAVNLPWSSSYRSNITLGSKNSPPLSESSKQVLLYAKQEANRAGLFWIDTDHLQAALFLEDGPSAAALEGIGYTLESTRSAGVDGRVRTPPRKPTIQEKFGIRVTPLGILVGFVFGLVIANLLWLLRSR
jgi:hypothetical protein